MHTSFTVVGLHAANTLVSLLRDVGISAFVTCATQHCIGSYEVRAIDTTALQSAIAGIEADITALMTQSTDTF